MVLEKEREIAVYAVRRAARIIAANSQSQERLKKDHTPQTLADVKSKDCIRSILRENFPEDLIITEEDEKEQLKERKARKKNCWIVDPLDGTSAFLRGSGDYGVIIGYVIGNEAMVGVTYNIPKRELVYASKGEGAHLFRERVTKRISVRFTEEFFLLRSNSRKSSELERMIEVLGISKKNQTRMSSALKLVEIAKGNGTLYLSPRDLRTNSWDLCGTGVILEEAGGRMTDVYGSRHHFRGNTANYNGVVGSNGIIHPRVLEAIKEVVY